MTGKVSRDDLVAAEGLYSTMGLSTEVDLCPYADTTALQALASGGYAVTGFTNIYARVLTDADLQEADESRIAISRVTASEIDDFLTCSAEGFCVTGRPVILSQTLAHIAVIRPDTRLYFAIIDGQIAGSAGLALMEASKGGVAHLYIDSTIPAYRGRGSTTPYLGHVYLTQGDVDIISRPSPPVLPM